MKLFIIRFKGNSKTTNDDIEQIRFRVNRKFKQLIVERRQGKVQIQMARTSQTNKRTDKSNEMSNLILPSTQIKVRSNRRIQLI